MLRNWLIPTLAASLVIVCLLVGFFFLWDHEQTPALQVPVYSGEPYVVVNANIPEFTNREKQATSYEFYSELDIYNRCGYAMACIGRDLMPIDERGSIGQVKPTGWQTVKYDSVDGKYLYNRCHLIGYQLTGENANPQNLITGTRYLNIEGMLPFENMVSDYVKETGNHVLYRVTPDFQGRELLARGVKIEGWSVEDHGAAICFNIYAYNVQPGIQIDYMTGESSEVLQQQETKIGLTGFYLNTSSKRFHAESCGQGRNIKQENREVYYGGRDSLLELGYLPAGCCEP